MESKLLFLVRTGKPLNEKIQEVLLVNACDMFENGIRRQRIAAHTYDGIISSTLEIFEFASGPYVLFEAILGSDMWEVNELQFVIKVDDLDSLLAIGHKGEEENIVCGCPECQQKRQDCGCDECKNEFMTLKYLEQVAAKKHLLELGQLFGDEPDNEVELNDE